MTASAADTRTDFVGLDEVNTVRVDVPVDITDTAVVKITELLEAQDQKGLSLRVAVQAGGCSGMQYQLFFDDQSRAGDISHSVKGVPVVVDQMSAPNLQGTTIDFSDTTEKQGFTIDNPNTASGGCACGGGGCGCGH